MIVAKHIRIQVRLKVVRTDSVINAINTPFDITPKAFGVVDVGLPFDVLLSGMVNGLMGIAECPKPIVASEFVGVDNGAWGCGNMLLDDGEQGLGFHVRSNDSQGVSFPLDHPEHDSFASRTTAPFTRPLATDIGFVGLYFAKEKRAILGHQLADLPEHTKCGAMIDSQFPLQLHRGNACPGLSHQEDGVEPRAKREFRLVEDGVGGGRDLGTAELTPIGLAPSNSEVLCDFPAPLASDPVRPARLEEEIKTRIVGGELTVKDAFRVLTHRCVLLSSLDTSIPQTIRVVNTLSPRVNKTDRCWLWTGGQNGHG